MSAARDFADIQREMYHGYVEAERNRAPICPEACDGKWHAVGCPNGPQFTLGMGTQPQQGPLTREAELEMERVRFALLEERWNELFRRQWDAAKALKACGARIVVLERIDHGGDLPGYAEAHGAR